MAKKAKSVEVKGNQVQVVWSRGSRIYSEAEHGKDFREIAKGFAAKSSINGKVFEVE